MSLKETILSMMLEALELSEAAKVSGERYARFNGKQPRDTGQPGSWMFTHKPSGDVNVNDKTEVHTAQGKLADAKKSAQKWAKEHGHKTVYVMESVELDEADAVVTHKWYSVKNWKDGSDHFDNLDDHLRGHSYKHPALGNTAKNRPDHHIGIPVKAKSAIAYMNKHASAVNEEVENNEEDKSTAYHFYATKNGIGAKEMKLTHAKSKPFTSETDALKHIVKTGGRQDGIIYKVNSATGKIVQHRGIDGGQKAYPTPASDMASDAPKHVRDLKEEVNQIDEISDEKKKEYIRAVADKGGILRNPRPGSLKGFDRKKDDALVKAFKGGSMQDYANLHKKSEKRAGIALNALNSLKKEEVELDESWNKGASSANRSDAIAAAKKKAEAAKLSAAANRLGKDHPQHSELMGAHHRAMAKSVKHSYHSGAYPSMKIAKDDHDRHVDQAKRYNSAVTENYELDEAKTDMYHKHMLKALGKTRLPKDHNYTSAIANNGDFVVHNAGRVVGRIAKGEHDLK